MHRTKVKVTEDALDANTTIAQANRADFDRHEVRVVNLMSAPGAGKTTLLEAALPSLPLDELDLLVIENVGNLVCPAEFRVGEDARIMVCSVTEGEDKPLKYPLMFRACELVIVNKIDLLEHLDFDLEKFLYHLDGVHPGVPHLLVSARTGEGMAGVRAWLARLAAPHGVTV